MFILFCPSTTTSGCSVHGPYRRELFEESLKSECHFRLADTIQLFSKVTNFLCSKRHTILKFLLWKVGNPSKFISDERCWDRILLRRNTWNNTKRGHTFRWDMIRVAMLDSLWSSKRDNYISRDEFIQFPGFRIRKTDWINCRYVPRVRRKKRARRRSNEGNSFFNSESKILQRFIRLPESAEMLKISEMTKPDVAKFFFICRSRKKK